MAINTSANFPCFLVTSPWCDRRRSDLLGFGDYFFSRVSLPPNRQQRTPSDCRPLHHQSPRWSPARGNSHASRCICRTLRQSGNAPLQPGKVPPFRTIVFWDQRVRPISHREENGVFRIVLLSVRIARVIHIRILVWRRLSKQIRIITRIADERWLEHIIFKIVQQIERISIITKRKPSAGAYLRDCTVRILSDQTWHITSAFRLGKRL